MKIGPYKITSLETCRFALDGGAMFGVVPRSLWQRSNPPDDQNRIAMAARILLLQSESRNILIDTGLGDKYDEKNRAIYGLDNTQYSLPSSLSAIGLAAADITDVIQTHLHFDHVGGLTERSPRGEIVPAFPNAKVYVQKAHMAWARNPTEKDRASFFPVNWDPVANAGLLEEIDGPGELFPGIELLIFNGHTAGQQLPHIFDDAGNHMFFGADLFPTKAHIPLPYIMGYDNFPLTTLEEKKTLLPRMYEEQWKLYFEHDPENTLTTIASTPKGWQAGEVLPFD